MDLDAPALRRRLGVLAALGVVASTPRSCSGPATPTVASAFRVADVPEHGLVVKIAGGGTAKAAVVAGSIKPGES